MMNVQYTNVASAIRRTAILHISPDKYSPPPLSRQGWLRLVQLWNLKVAQLDRFLLGAVSNAVGMDVTAPPLSA